ncbi:MAG: hydantoinase/oxoprolinase family protein [Gammaproteobacteria bacterium]|jgi:N-methylhydantoinase A|nr:hydantoinase/oxoprolinase family protein [Gammaproteobacteria bacterium]
MAKYLGIDTGGTFTDFILFDNESKTVRIHKVLSTPQAPEKAIMQGVADLGIEGDDLAIIHGSTVATNAVLEGKGVSTAYITNKGLADVLAIGRQAREELYNLTPTRKPPLIERQLCLEVNSRLSASGEQLQQLSEQDLSELTAQLAALAPKAVAINLLFSFIDESEELKIEKAIVDRFGEEGVFISRSSDVLPEYKEFERGMTTALNAKVGPLMQGYLQRLEDSLTGQGKQKHSQGTVLSIMQSSGGITSARQAGRYPVNLLLSGPAGGLKGAQTVAAASAISQLLSFDMGGTSTDVSIIDKKPGFTSGAKIGGYPVAVPMVDMHTIGAGGGSIAQVDAGGLLLVGPESAAADPGPACYGKGGKRPTVTDANVVLGRLLPQSFLGGNMRLDKAAAIAALKNVAAPLGLTVEQAAMGIIEVVNDHMVRALRVMSVERGEDPKDFTLVSFGGAGGLHVCALAEALEMTKALVPVNAGVLSALGMLAAEASRERSRTINRPLKDCDTVAIEQLFAELASLAIAELNPATVFAGNEAISGSQPGRLQDLLRFAGNDSIKLVLTVDVRYRGQSYALNLPWRSLQNIEPDFHKKHRDSYGHELAIDIELVNLRVRAIEQRQSFELPRWQPSEELTCEFVTMPGIAQAVAVMNRAGLPVGHRIEGPALITETSATTWLATGWIAEIDSVGNIDCRSNKPDSR